MFNSKSYALMVIVPAFLLVIMAGTPAQAADNDHKVVIGLGIGGHSFSTTDEVRDGGVFTPDLNGGLVSDFLVEWYFLGNFGIGYRSVSIATGRVYTFGPVSVTENINYSAGLITANWIPFTTSDKYVRYGLLGGIGGSSMSRTWSDGSNSVSNDTSGSASLFGGFIDWGAEGFGARFGFNSLKTSLDPFKEGAATYEVDGSGSHWYFDLRWAF